MTDKPDKPKIGRPKKPVPVAPEPKVKKKPGPKPDPTKALRRPSGRPNGRPPGQVKVRPKPDRPKIEGAREAPPTVRYNRKAKRAYVADWAQIEADYVQGVMVEGRRLYPNFVDLAEEYGVNLSTIWVRGNEGGWEAKRRSFQDELKRKLYEITPGKIAEMHAKNLEAMNFFVDLAKAKLGDRDRGFEVDHEALAKADSDEAQRLLSLAERAIQNIRTMLGQPTSISEQRVQNNTKVDANVGLAAAVAKSPDLVAALAGAMQAISQKVPAVIPTKQPSESEVTDE